MTRRVPPGRPARNKAQARAAPGTAVTERGVVPVDGDALREKARRELEEARRKLAATQSEIDRFEQRDLQAFHAWMQAELAERMQALRELSLQSNRKLERVLMLEEEIFATGLDAETCLRRVDKRLREEDTDFSGGDEPSDEDDDDLSGDEDVEEAFNQAFDEVFGQEPGEDEPEDHRTPPPRRKKPEHKLDKESKGELKRLYRELVRRCHPDRTGKHDPASLALWHSVQEAYLAQDVGRMAMLHAGLEHGPAGAVRSTIGHLLGMVKSMGNSLRDAQRLLARAKKHPAWNFLNWDLTRRQRLREKLERDLRRDEDAIRDNSHRYDLALAALLREYPARRGKPGRSTRGRR